MHTTSRASACSTARSAERCRKPYARPSHWPDVLVADDGALQANSLCHQIVPTQSRTGGDHRVSAPAASRPARAAPLHALHRRGSWKPRCSMKNRCSPAVRTNGSAQSAHSSVSSSYLVLLMFDSQLAKSDARARTGRRGDARPRCRWALGRPTARPGDGVTRAGLVSRDPDSSP